MEPFKNKPVDVIVLPELALTGYDFLEEYERVFNLSEESPLNSSAGLTFEYSRQLATEFHSYVAIGYIERERMSDDCLRNYQSETSFFG